VSEVCLAIGGMGCPACALEIERVLRTVPGLAAVRVDAATAEARFSLEEGTGALEAAVAGSATGRRRRAAPRLRPGAPPSAAPPSSGSPWAASA
jgi:copper chaperone CopZ